MPGVPMLYLRLNRYVTSAVALLMAASIFNNSVGTLQAQELVKYRHVKQTTVHIVDGALAQEHAKNLKSLGCDVTLSKRLLYYDLTYQCEEWHEVNFETHEQTHKWISLLSSLGFEVGHFH